MRGNKGSQTAMAYLPYLPNDLIVVDKTPLVNESLAVRSGTARADLGYLVFNIADR